MAAELVDFGDDVEEEGLHVEIERLVVQKHLMGFDSRRLGGFQELNILIIIKITLQVREEKTFEITFASRHMFWQYSFCSAPSSSNTATVPAKHFIKYTEST